MYQLFNRIIKLLLFWIVFFFIQRVLFFAFAYVYTSKAEFSSILYSNWFAARYDLSSGAYLAAIPFLLLCARGFNLVKSSRKTIFIFNVLLVILLSVVNAADIELYKAWGSKLNMKAISYLAYPSEVYNSVASSSLTMISLVLILQVFAGIFILRKINSDEIKGKIPKWQTFLFLLIAAAGLVLAIRGGTQRIPLNKGWSYFSNDAVANHASVNPLWNLVYNLTHDIGKKNPYNFFKPEDAESLTRDLNKYNRYNSKKIISIPRPNIIVILLESWSVDVIAELGGERDVTPEFNDLCNDGLLFTNFYSSGLRSEQGLISLVSGLPAQPKTSIIRNFGKFEKLPSMLNKLKSEGYYTSAYYGGNLDFANTGPYLRSAGIREIFGKDDIPHEHATLWGAWDEYLFRFMSANLSNSRLPFFTIALTSSSHEPFDNIGTPAFPGDDMGMKYRSSVYYSDKSLGEFFRLARKEPWYSNTVFLLLSDHSHLLPKGRDIYEPDRYRIPLLIYGDALKSEFRGMKSEKFSTQFDLVATILGQLDTGSEEFNWSKDMFNPSAKSFAYYTFEDGFGWMSENSKLVFDNQANRIVYEKRFGKTAQVDSVLIKGKAYLQHLQEEFLTY